MVTLTSVDERRESIHEVSTTIHLQSMGRVPSFTTQVVLVSQSLNQKFYRDTSAQNALMTAMMNFFMMKVCLYWLQNKIKFVVHM